MKQLAREESHPLASTSAVVGWVSAQKSSPGAFRWAHEGVRAWPAHQEEGGVERPTLSSRRPPVTRGGAFLGKWCKRAFRWCMKPTSAWLPHRGRGHPCLGLY